MIVIARELLPPEVTAPRSARRSGRSMPALSRLKVSKTVASRSDAPAARCHSLQPASAWRTQILRPACQPWHTHGSHRTAPQSRRRCRCVTASAALLPRLSLLPATSPWGIWAGLALAAAGGFWSERTRVGKELSGAHVPAVPIDRHGLPTLTSSDGRRIACLWHLSASAHDGPEPCI